MSRDELMMKPALESPPLPSSTPPPPPPPPPTGEKKLENGNSSTTSENDDDLEEVDLGVERGVGQEKWKRLLLWQPPRTRWDERNPPRFTVWINLLFGFVSCPSIGRCVVIPPTHLTDFFFSV